MWAFGNNEYGQLGIDSDESSPYPVSVDIKAKSVFAGDYHSILIDLEDNVWVTGLNILGQLGLGDMEDRYVFTMIPDIKAKSASVGTYHSAIIDLEDNVWVFGRNMSGQLGLGHSPNTSIPTEIPNMKAKAISLGFIHTILIDLNDNVYSFGRNSVGQLGIPLDNRGYGQIVGVPKIIPGLKAKSISAGDLHSVVIDLDDNVWVFGQDTYGQLGLGDEAYLSKYDTHLKSEPVKISGFKASQISAGGRHTIMIGNRSKDDV